MKPIGSRLQAFQRAKDESHTLPLSFAPNGGLETLIRCFTFKADILYKTLLQSIFTLKRSDKAFILPLVPHNVAQKCNSVHYFANNAARKSKTYQASRSFSAIAELLLTIVTYSYKPNTGHERIVIFT